jgi:hypothetical protein
MTGIVSNQISDRFLIISPLAKCTTINPPTTPKTLPTFDVLIYLSLVDQLSVVELVVYDKDMLSKEHLRVVVLLVEDWFANQEGGLFDDTRDGSQEKC